MPYHAAVLQSFIITLKKKLYIFHKYELITVYAFYTDVLCICYYIYILNVCVFIAEFICMHKNSAIILINLL